MKRVTADRSFETAGRGTLKSALFLSVCLFPLAFGSAAFAQDEDSKLEVSGEATVVVGVVDGETEADADAKVKVKGSTILDNGLEVGGVVEARVDGDVPRQYWAGGRYSSFTAGGPRGVTPLDGDLYLQTVMGYVRGGFGQLSVGRDNGIASQLAVTSPTIFSAIGVNDWRTDLTGLNDVQTVNDFSGYSTKLTYMPPANFLGGALGGLQLGVSYAPELEDCDNDLCAPVGGYSPLTPPEARLAQGASWRDVLETGLYYETAIGKSDDVRLGLGASYISATEDINTLTNIELDDYTAYALGVNLAVGGLTVGGSVKETNQGFANEDDEGYLAFDAGVTYVKGPWGFMLGYGQSDADRDVASPLDPRFRRETQSAQAGVSYVFDQGVTFGAAAQFVDSEKPDEIGGDEDATAIIFESSIKF